MDKIKLLSYGYLFKELPPVFNSIELGSKFHLLELPKYTNTKCIDFSLPKGQYARRVLQLPHPYNYIHLVNHLTETNNWKLMQDHFEKSIFSNSIVKENKKAGQKIENKDNRATQTNYNSFNASKRKAILDAYDMLYELKVDISKYYPSIYTHSIVWAILSKERAKKIWRIKEKDRPNEPDFSSYEFADKLDCLIRSCQDNQSVGIPIGPDSSHIIAEIIGCFIDKQIQNEFPELKAFRYFDDYHIYIETEEKGQIVLRFIQQILAELQLSLNENKLKISKFPFEFEEKWVKEINDVTFNEPTEKNIKQYFSVLFGLVNKNPQKSDTIFKYAFKTFEKRTTEINKEHWDIFEALLLKSVLVEPSSLEMVSRILETYKTFVSISKLKSIIEKILEMHCSLNHHFETVWALWILKQFGISLSKNWAEKIINTGDGFSILLLLDLNNNGLLDNGGLDASLKQNISDLLDDQTNKMDWLLYYEAVEIKKWIPSTKRTDLSELAKHSISFYDPNEKIKTFDIPTKKNASV